MAFPEWFVGPPVAGGPNQYQVVQANDQSTADQLTNEGYKGPYSSKAAAQGKADDATSAAKSTEISLPNLDPLSGIAGSLTAFYDAITDGKLWRSLAWVVLGVLVMLLGVALWIGPSASRASPLGLATRALG